MTCLLTGSLGKTTSRLASFLSEQDTPLIIAAHSGTAKPCPSARFDWSDSSTWSLPFSHSSAKASSITSVYLVGPSAGEAADQVIGFIDLARQQGVRRFVFLSGSAFSEGAQEWHGRVRRHLRSLGDQGSIEWTVIRPTWFMRASPSRWHMSSSISPLL